jgi:hypothetical protein
MSHIQIRRNRMVKLMLTLLAIGPLVLAGVAPSSAQVRPDSAHPVRLGATDAPGLGSSDAFRFRPPGTPGFSAPRAPGFGSADAV